MKATLLKAVLTCAIVVPKGLAKPNGDNYRGEAPIGRMITMSAAELKLRVWQKDSG
ncbi:hypothetical protein [Mucilaginibacter flavidus]|uniref:hypothetical protein n=1 Tax=Mucilaginibacter flavidus TaxID=2949309 RepID=UPI002093799E|nr:hypothetical protein [Mucilaginibacter flavidus]MCO5950023.1 hypothetical protein [Mucilaginibacter flavidus]